jgi:hypothetical protein
MFARASIQALRGMDPTSVAMTSPDVLQKQILQTRLKTEELNYTQVAAEADAKGELAHAYQYGTPDEQYKARQKLAAIQGRPEAVRPRAMEEVEERTANDTLAAQKALDAAGGDATKLNPYQQALLHIQTGPLDDYNALIGVGPEGKLLPGKLYRNHKEAFEAYATRMAEIQALAGGGSAASREYTQFNTDLRTYLHSYLQTDEGAEEYHLAKPLGPLDPVPETAMAQARLHLKDKLDPNVKVNIDKAISTAIFEAMKTYDSDAQEQIKAAFVIQDPATGRWEVRPTPPVETHTPHRFRSDTIAGIPVKDFYDARRRFLNNVIFYIDKNNKGASAKRILEAFETPDVAGYLMNKPPEPEGAAGAGAAGAQATPGAKKPYRVTDDFGRTAENPWWMDDEKLKTMQKSLKGWKFVPWTATTPPAGP